MKCDELKVCVPQDGPWGLEPEEGGELVEEETCYLKSEVDAAIDELKTEHHKERHEYIEMVAQLRRENAELKAENERLKNGKMYTKLQHDTIIDAMSRSHHKELRATKRALWLARAWGANQRTKYLDLFLTGRAHAIRKYKWIKITSKCRAKAEEYK